MLVKAQHGLHVLHRHWRGFCLGSQVLSVLTVALHLQANTILSAKVCSIEPVCIGIES